MNAPAPPTVDRLTLKGFAVACYQRFSRGGATGLATQIAYSFLFAIFPLFILLMALAALADRVFNLPIETSMREAIDRYAPVELEPLLDALVDSAIGQVNGETASVSAFVAFLLAVWGGSGGIGALVLACNRVYGVRDTRPFYERRFTTLLLTLTMAALIVTSAALFIAGTRLAEWISDELGAGSRATALLDATRWTLIVVLLLIALVALYLLGTNVDQSPLRVLPGAALASIGWLVALTGFGLALKITNPSSAYGAAGSVILLLWFFYVTGLVFIVGAVINAVLGADDPRRRADLARHPEKRLFGERGVEC